MKITTIFIHDYFVGLYHIYELFWILDLFSHFSVRKYIL